MAPLHRLAPWRRRRPRPWRRRGGAVRHAPARGILFGIAPLDPVTFLAAPALLAITALATCLLPGLRATAGEPARVLRCE